MPRWFPTLRSPRKPSAPIGVRVGCFVGVYWLWVPGLALLALWLYILTKACRARQRRAAALIVIPMVCGLLHGAYIVRVGGDFMHGRMLLPSLFACLLPVSVVAGTRWWHAAWPALVVVPWALVCALWLRVPYLDQIGPLGIADERGVYVSHLRRPHPITLADYGAAYVTRDGQELRRLALERRALLLGDEIASDRPPPLEARLAPWVARPIVAGRRNVGLLGYAAGPGVHLVDRWGLGDPIAARLRIDQRSRPGHEKWLSDDWMLARFADPAAPLPIGAPPAPLVDAARSALACPPLKELLEAIGAPLTLARFLHNVGVAWRLRNLTIPSDPRQAVAELCVRSP